MYSRYNESLKIICRHNGTADITGRTRRVILSARGYNGTMKIHRGQNGTADTTGRTSRSVVSARGHNGTADTTGRNTGSTQNMVNLLNSPYGPQKCSTERTRTVFGVGRASASAVTIRFKPSIIVRFYRRTIRNDIIRARRALKGSAVSIREDLTRLNQALLNRAMNHPRVYRAWTWNGKINVVGHNGNRVTLTPFCDIDSVLDIANLGH